MFASKVAKSQQIATAARSTAKLAPHRSGQVAQFWGADEDWSAPQRGQVHLHEAALPSWDFNEVPIFPPSQESSSALPRLRPKLDVGAVNDPLEREADRIADQVMSMPDPKLSMREPNPGRIDDHFERMRPPGASAPSIDKAPGASLQRMCAQCAEGEKEKPTPRAEDVEEPEREDGTGIAVDGDMPLIRPPAEALAEREEEQPLSPAVHARGTIRRMHAGGVLAPGALAETLAGTDGSRGGGQPLDAETRSFFEPRFGHSFTHVRVHTDTQAAESAAAVHALAYTVGGNIVFAAGRYAPGSQSGRRLLAHELTHVVQQGGGRPRSVAAAAMAVLPSAGAAGVLQRWSVDGPADASINTIVCDGSGGVRVQIGTGNDATSLPCLVDCLRQHEGSHRADALAANPRVCKRWYWSDYTDGTQVNMDGTGEQKPSEIKASQAEIDCLNAKLTAASKECEPAIRQRITQMIAFRDSFK